MHLLKKTSFLLKKIWLLPKNTWPLLKKTWPLSNKNWSARFSVSLAVWVAVFLAPGSRAQRDDNHDVDTLVNALFGQSDIFSWTVNGHYTLKEHLLWSERFKDKAARWAEISKANALKDSEFRFAPVHASGKLPTRIRKNEIYEGTRVDFSRVYLPDLQSELKFPIVEEIPSTRVALIGFWARSKSPQTIRVSFKLSSSKPGYQIWQSSAKLDSQWRYYAGETEVPPCKPNEYSVAFSAFSPQSTFDVQNNVQLLTMDKPEPIKSSSEKEIDNLIEFIRKDKLTIHVINSAGKSVPSAKVAVEQLRHEFTFGCVANFTPGKSVNQENCQNKLASLFNCAAFPISWNLIEPNPNKLDFSQLDASSQWCAEQHRRSC